MILFSGGAEVTSRPETSPPKGRSERTLFHKNHRIAIAPGEPLYSEKLPSNCEIRKFGIHSTGVDIQWCWVWYLMVPGLEIITRVACVSCRGVWEHVGNEGFADRSIFFVALIQSCSVQCNILSNDISTGFLGENPLKSHGVWI